MYVFLFVCYAQSEEKYQIGYCDYRCSYYLHSHSFKVFFCCAWETT